MDLKPIFKQIETLRNPDGGCPWDQAQVLEEYLKPIASEAEELLAALQAGDMENVCEEVGDLLWNLCFVIHMAEERGEFTREEVLSEITAKMVRRHPHVYGDVVANTPEEALAAFKKAKAEEKKKGG
ncbi:MAG: nucleotide pyrophosphohydrolase [Planctomycetes bacterium]|nr:nucleotide pyrophosphohydrolase [Planctomycetota bacterium]